MYKLLYLKLLCLLFLMLFLIAPSCDSGGQPNSGGQSLNLSVKEEGLPTRRALRRMLWQKRSMTFVYSSNPEQEAFFQERIAALNLNKRFGIEVTGIKIEQLAEKDISKTILFFIGNLTTNPILKEFRDLLPVSLQEKSFVFDEKEYHSKQAIFKLFYYPNPHNPTLPFYLITGNDDSAIHEFLKNEYPTDWSRLFRSSWGYEVFDEGTLKVAGHLNEKTWEMDKKIHFDFSHPNDSILQTQHFQFITHQSTLSKAQIEAIAKQCESTYRNISQFMGKEITLPRIDYHFYPSVENKGLQRNSMQEATANFKENKVDVVVNSNFKGSQLQQENKLILRRILGQAQLLALEEGLSNHFTQNWQEKGYKHWTSVLFYSDNLPPLKELLDNTFFERESVLVMGAMSGVFIDFLITHFGKTSFLKNYKNWRKEDLQGLDKAWKNYLSTNLEQPERTTAKSSSASYLKGFNFAHEGYRVYNGYGSQLAKESLERLAELGSNAAAIVPYSFMRDPNIPASIPVHYGSGGENDQAVLFAHFEAQRMGFHTMLKPQIWLGGSWPGDIEMKNEADWNSFFDYYYRWVRHYALLAEINGFDSYCIGVEFAKATLARERDWRNLIRKLRGIYSGQLTYAANWGEEFENLKFWDEFDFIGLNCYYPLSKKNSPSKRELSKAFAKVINKIERVCDKYDKPLVFTEIGFRSVDGTWKNPHAKENGRTFNGAAQELCYEVILEGIKNKKWCKGILWWKWPSHLGYRGTNNTGFSPNHKQTETIISKYFKTKI